MRILLLFLTSVFIYADIGAENFQISGEFKVRAFDTSKDVSKGKGNGKGEGKGLGKRVDYTINEQGISTSLQLDIKYTDGDFKFVATPFFNSINTASGDKISNINFTHPYDNSDFFFRSLYMSYKIDDFTFGAGVLPLSNSFPMEYTDDYYSDGSGLAILNDINMMGAFVKYDITENSNILFMIHQIDALGIPTGQYSDDNYEDGTRGATFMQKSNWDKYKMINQVTYLKSRFRNTHYGTMVTVGHGSSWDDSEYTGLTLYNSIGFSSFEPNPIILKQPNKTEKFYGAALLLGIRYDIDELFGMGSFINAEWFHTFGDWVSGNHGEPYNSNYNYTYNIRNDAYFINYGIMVTEEITLKLSYAWLEFEDKSVFITPPDFVNYKNQNILKFTFSYKF